MITESLLNFVDLAGSEKVSNHQISTDDPNQYFNIINNNDILTQNGEKQMFQMANKMKDRVKEG